MDTLHSLMKRTRECFGVHLCVHDVSGVTYARKSLSLPYLMMQHGCDYCTAVKRCVSEPRCMKQKQLVMWMLRKNGMKPFYGVCHMGVCEYILPVCQSGRLLAVVFASGLVKNDEPDCRSRMLRAKEKAAPALRQLLEESYGMFVQESTVSRETLRFFAELAGERILRAAVGLTDADEGDPYAVESVREGKGHCGTVRAILGYIEASLPGAITLGDISSVFFMSEGHLCRLFRKEMGMSIIAYVKRQRMLMAARLLRDSGESVSDISARVGVSDPNYFCRAFKQEMGVTPSEYRSNALNSRIQGQNRS